MTPGRVVWIVDDDPLVRRALERLVASLGLQAETFGSAEEFLGRRPEPQGDPVLVLDMRMPGMTGIELQRSLAEAGSEIPVIFVTGHGEAMRTDLGLERQAVAVLGKPIDLADLESALQQAFGDAG